MHITLSLVCPPLAAVRQRQNKSLARAHFVMDPPFLSRVLLSWQEKKSPDSPSQRLFPKFFSFAYQQFCYLAIRSACSPVRLYNRISHILELSSPGPPTAFGILGRESIPSQ